MLSGRTFDPLADMDGAFLWCVPLPPGGAILGIDTVGGPHIHHDTRTLNQLAK